MQVASLALTISIFLCHLLTTACVDEEAVRVCPQNSRDWTAAAKRKECVKKGGDYHCVRNQVDKLVESCVPKVWIDSGDCPILYVASGNFGYEKCPTGRKCPAARYMSDTVYLYPACFERKTVTTAQNAQTTQFTHAGTTDGSTERSKTSTDKQEDEIIVWSIAVPISVGVIVGLWPLFLCIWFWRRGKENKLVSEDEERTPFLPAAVQISTPGIECVGKLCTITCDLNLTATEIIWKKDNEMLNTKDESKYEGGTPSKPSLTIKKLTKEDTGIYQCICLTDGSGEKQESNTVKLEVHDIKIECPLKIKVGVSVTIKFSIAENYSEEAKVKWMKNYGVLNISSQSVYEGGTISNPALVIKKFSKQDEGYYQCVITSGKDKVMKSNNVTLAIPDVPHVYLIQPSDAALDKDVTIHCVVRGAPDVSILCWKKDGKPLDIMDQNKYKGGSLDEPTLTIYMVSLDDVGNYQCSATNSKGTGKSNTVTLNVVETPHIFEEVEVEKTTSIEKAKKMIDKEGMVILVGDMGTGKTVTLEQVHGHVCFGDPGMIWETKNAEYNYDKDVEENKSLVFSKRFIICLDDCCRKNILNHMSIKFMQYTLCGLRKLAKNYPTWRKGIATFTRAEFDIVKSSLEKDDKESLESVVIKLSEITEDDKENFMKEYNKQSKCQCKRCKEINWNEKMQLLKEEQHLGSLQVLGWPLVCRLIITPHIAQYIGEFVNAPFFVLMQSTEEMKKKDTGMYCGLVYMMLKGGTFDETCLDHECLRHVFMLNSALPEHDHDLDYSIKLVTQQLQTVPEYVKYSNDQFTFFHDIMTLALFCSFYKKYPNEAIRLCDLQIIAELFRPEGYGGSEGSYLKTLVGDFFDDDKTIGYHETQTQDKGSFPEATAQTTTSNEEKSGSSKDMKKGNRKISKGQNQNDNTNEEKLNKTNGSKSKKNSKTSEQTVGTESHQKAVSEKPTGYEAHTKVMKKQKKYPFSLNEENRDILMKRITDEGRLDLFENHPLMKETQYKV